jgi:hypothetical protein
MQTAALALAWHALLAQPAAAARESAPLVLEWRTSTACESGSDVEAEVARLLRSAQGEQRSVRALAELSDAGQGALQVKLQLEVAGAPHERGFLAESCKAAKSAVALILAIAINPAAAESEPKAGEAPPAETDSPASSVSPKTPKAASVPEPAPPNAEAKRPPAALPRAPAAAHVWGFNAGVFGLLDAGSMPRSDVGLGLHVGLEIADARIELSGSALAAQTVLDATGAGARFSLLHTDLRFGYGARLGAVWLGPLLGAGLSSLTASGTKGSASVSARAATELVPELSAGALGVWSPTRSLGLRLGADLVAPLVRPRFLVDQPAPAEPTVLHRSSRVGGRVMLGIAVQFL